jgi:acetyl esterase/lipase
VVVIPGGGYHFVSPREGKPVAEKFFNAGYNVFILDYSTTDRFPEVHYPAQLLQALSAVRYIRENAEKLHCDGQIAVCGFSAGGHLAAMTGTLYNDAEIVKTMGVSAKSIKPDALVLCYAVLTAGKYAHRGTLNNLTGTEDVSVHKKFSLEKLAGKHTPPSFLWNTDTDTAVPPQNSIQFAAALKACGVPYELHIFEKGPHGLSVCDETTWENNPAYVAPDVALWIPLAVNFLKKRFLAGEAGSGQT